MLTENNKHPMSLHAVVSLYRSCTDAEFEDGQLSGVADTPDAINFLRTVYEENDNNTPTARVSDLEVDGETIEPLLGDPIPADAGRVKYVIELPGHSASRFHKDFSEFVEHTPSLGKGEIPTDYYLVAENYYSETDTPTGQVATLAWVCNVIKNLKSLADYANSENGHYTLVFIQSESKPVELSTALTPAVLARAKASESDPTRELAGSGENQDPHHRAKLSIFNTTLADFTERQSNPAEAFAYFIANLSSFGRHFHRNFCTYSSGFSFHTARHQVATAELEIASKLSSVLTDIAGKVLSVPVSMIAVVAMIRADGPLEKLLLAIGVIIASILLTGAIKNQLSQLEKVVDASRLTLFSIQGDKEAFPEELRKKTINMAGMLGNDQRRITRWLLGFGWACALPALVAIALMVLWYGQVVYFSVIEFLKFLC